MATFKTCTSCGKYKPLDAFHRDATRADGHKEVCKVCRMNAGKEAKKARQARPEAIFAAMPMDEDTPTASAGVDGDGTGPDELAIEAPESPAQPQGKESLVQSILSAMKGGGEPVKRAKSEESEVEALAEQIALGGGYAVSLGAAFLIPHPYKPAGPQPQHAHDIIKPLAEIVAERLDLAGKLSKDAIRLAQSAMAAMMYADYALRTATTIRAQVALERARHAGNAGGYAPAPAGYAGAGDLAAYGQRSAPQADGRAEPYGTLAAGNGYGAAAPDGRAGQNGASGGSDADRQAAAIRGLLAADAHGRRQLGLGG